MPDKSNAEVEKAKQDDKEEFVCEECSMYFSSLTGLRIHCGKAKHELPEKFRAGEKVKIRIRYIASGLYEGVPYEAIYYEGVPTFLIRDKYEKLITIAELPSGIEGTTFRPPEVSLYPQYSFDKESLEVFNNWEPNPLELYEAVYEEFDAFLFLEPKYKALFSVQTLESYQQHKLTTTSYPFAEGLNESGKSHYLIVQSNLSYRSLFSSNVSTAAVFTFLGQHPNGCTILEDEAQDLNAKGREMKMNIYRVGYQRKAGNVYRVRIHKDGGRSLDKYPVFGPKTFAGLYMPADRGFQERCIRIPFTTGDPEKDEFEPEDYERWNKIRLGLLVWRLKTYSEPLNKIELPIGLKGRQKELWKPKLLIAAGLPAEAIIRELVLEHTELKHREWASSIEAYICRAIIAARLAFGNIDVVHFRNIWNNLVYLLTGVKVAYLLLDGGVMEAQTEETKKQSFETAQFGKVSKRLLGFKLKSVFNGERLGRFGNETVYSFEEDRLLRTGKRFLVVPLEVNSLSELDSNAILEQKLTFDTKEASDEEVEDTAQPEESPDSYFDLGQEAAREAAEQAEISYELKHPSQAPVYPNEDEDKPLDPAYYPEDEVNEEDESE